MPGPHPRRQLGGDNLLERRHVRDWAPPGWHWEVLPSGARSLVRNQAPVVDPELLWWRSRGPVTVRRLESPAEVVRHRVREEDEHVRRYLVRLDTQAVHDNMWYTLYRDPPHVSIAPVMVPYLWVQAAGRSAPRGLGPGNS